MPIKTAPTITLPALRALKPCRERLDALEAILPARTTITAAVAVALGATFDDLVWVAKAVARHDPDVERRIRLWLADCAAHVLHIYERDSPQDMRPRDAIIASRRFARGEIDAAARAAAWDAAWDAARAAARAAAGDAARDAARAAAGDAAGDAAWAAARDGEEKWQFDRLVQWLSADEPADLEFKESRKS